MRSSSSSAPSRARKLQIRDDFRRWQPALGTLLQVQITGLQYLYEHRFSEFPQPIAKALAIFEEDMATVARAMADTVAGNVPHAVPDVLQSALRSQEEIRNHHLGTPIPPPLVDMMTLTQNLASIIAPLYSDIRATFTNLDRAVVHHPQLKPTES